MPAYTVRTAKHQTLAANTEDTITLTSSPERVEVYARTADIWFTVDGTAPTVRGDNVYVVTAGTSLIVGTGASSLTIVPPKPVVIRLLSATSTDYSVTAAA